MKYLRFFMPKLEYIVLIAVFWGIAVSGPKILNFDGDLPRHLLLGQLIRETKSVSLTDMFSFRTAGVPSFPHEWLSQVVLSISYDVLGLNGVVLLTASLFMLTWGIISYETRRRSNNLFASLITLTLGLSASMIHVLPRPHLFTYLFTALWIVVLEQVNQDKPRRWWLLPVLMLFWVNLHGMFVLGIAIWAIYVTGSFLENPSRSWFSEPPTKALLLGGSLSIVTTIFSPSGPGIWRAVISLGSNSYITSRIPEYQSANFHVPEMWPFILLLVMVILSFARAQQKTPWTDILLTASFAAIALYTSRMIPLFAIVAVPIVAETLSVVFKQEFSTGRLFQTEANLSAINSSSNGTIWLVVGVLGVTLLLASGRTIDANRKGNTFDERFFPVHAVNWLNSNPQDGHMLNEFDWGGYLLLKMFPRQQIFMDGHTHIYGEALTREYEEVMTLQQNWQEILDKYQITWAIVRTESQIAHALEHNGWNVIYSDETAVILKK
jgi:hypothetical protein